MQSQCSSKAASHRADKRGAVTEVASTAAPSLKISTGAPMLLVRLDLALSLSASDLASFNSQDGAA